jgi:hydroxyacylglutathione hydrolase
MKLFFHFAVIGFSNIYLLGPDEPGDAILIDPGIMDVGLLKMIENHGYYIKSVLVTHSHTAHIHGLKTLMKIYNPDIYASSLQIFDYPCHHVMGGDSLHLSGCKIDVIDVPGHSNDSLVYKIDNLVFAGDVLSAGSIGSTPNGYARALLLSSIREKIFPLGENCVIFPGHGPPTTLAVEQLTNMPLREKF